MVPPEDLLCCNPKDWPHWTFSWLASAEGMLPGYMTDHEARLPLLPNGTSRLSRSGNETIFHTPEQPSPDVLVHPALTANAAVASCWLGRDGLHGGAFL